MTTKRDSDRRKGGVTSAKHPREQHDQPGDQHEPRKDTLSDLDITDEDGGKVKGGVPKVPDGI